MVAPLKSAHALVTALREVADPDEVARIRPRVATDEAVIGVRMGVLFDTAKRAVDLPSEDLERLFTDPAYEARLAALCILDFRCRGRLTPAERRDLATVYLDHHDAITTWDMVDRAAPRVLGWPILIGEVEFSVLEDLAHSSDPLRRRSAMTAPLWFLKKGNDADVARGLALADLLADDAHPRVASAVKIYRKHAARRG